MAMHGFRIMREQVAAKEAASSRLPISLETKEDVKPRLRSRQRSKPSRTKVQLPNQDRA